MPAFHRKLLCSSVHFGTLKSPIYTRLQPGCKVSKLVRSICFGQNADLTSGPHCSKCFRTRIQVAMDGVSQLSLLSLLPCLLLARGALQFQLPVCVCRGRGLKRSLINYERPNFLPRRPTPPHPPPRCETRVTGRRGGFCKSPLRFITSAGEFNTRRFSVFTHSTFYQSANLMVGFKRS